MLRLGVKDDPFDLNGPLEAGVQMIMDPWKDVYSSIKHMYILVRAFRSVFFPLGLLSDF